MDEIKVQKGFPSSECTIDITLIITIELNNDLQYGW